MKRKTLLLIAALVALPGVTYADSPFSSLQSAHEKKHDFKGFAQNVYAQRRANR